MYKVDIKITCKNGISRHIFWFDDLDQTRIYINNKLDKIRDTDTEATAICCNCGHVAYFYSYNKSTDTLYIKYSPKCL